MSVVPWRWRRRNRRTIGHWRRRTLAGECWWHGMFVVLVFQFEGRLCWSWRRGWSRAGAGRLGWCCRNWALPFLGLVRELTGIGQRGRSSESRLWRCWFGRRRWWTWLINRHSVRFACSSRCRGWRRAGLLPRARSWRRWWRRRCTSAFGVIPVCSWCRWCGRYRWPRLTQAR